MEPPQCLWSRPHERSEVRGRPSGQWIHRFHGNAPPSLHPQGPVHLEVRRGARESRLCPGCWTGQPSHPSGQAGLQHSGGGVPVGGRESRPGRMEGGPSTPHAPVRVPLSLPWDAPPWPPRPLLALLMPCWLPGTLGVSSYSSHKRTRAKVQPEAPWPKSASLVGVGSTEPSGRAGEVSRAALWFPAGSSSTL